MVGLAAWPGPAGLNAAPAPRWPARGFAGPVVAAEVLREVQLLALTPALARLGYTSPRPAGRYREPDHRQPARWKPEDHT
jgi:hypothetical protein